MTDKEIFEKAMHGDKSIIKLPEDKLKIKDRFWNTPIHYLAMEGVKEVLKLPEELLMIKNEFGDTPLYYVTRSSGVTEFNK